MKEAIVSPTRPERCSGLTRLAEEITKEVIAALSEGVRPWQQPWDDALVPGVSVRPLRHTGQGYAGINVILLWLASARQGFTASTWMTYRQAQAYGGQVRQGEKGTPVVYADRFPAKTRDAESGEELERLIPFLRSYAVFNVEQIDNLPERFRPIPPPPLSLEQEASRVLSVETFFRQTGAVIRHLGVTPSYLPGIDEIRLPAPAAFPTAPKYYATLAHELIHWTRHESRLNRDLGREKWGDAGYAREELVAELGAALLCADLGLTPEIREDHAPYIGHWLRELYADPKALFRAAAHAERAVRFLRGEAVGAAATLV